MINKECATKKPNLGGLKGAVQTNHRDWDIEGEVATIRKILQNHPEWSLTSPRDGNYVAHNLAKS